MSAAHPNQKSLLILMGVSGCGKSSVAEALSAATGHAVLEADTFHSAANVAKMAGGTPLTDADRADWIRAIAAASAADPAQQLILACSALTPFVQTELSENCGRRCVWIYLKGSPELVRARLNARDNHFMTDALLESQFAALDLPDGAIPISIDQSIFHIVTDIQSALNNQH